MTISFQKWLAFTLRQNRRPLLVALCGFGIVLPLCVMTAQGSLADAAWEMVFIFASIFSVMCAIYLFRFLYHPGAAALALTMPISRRALFIYHWLCGWLLTLLLTTVYAWFCSGLAMRVLLNTWLAGVVFQSVLYTITVCFVSRCRRTLDALLIGYGWIVLFVLLQVSFVRFIDTRSAYLIEAYSYYGSTAQMLMPYFSFFSLPSFGADLFAFTAGYTYPTQMHLLLIVWWSAIAVLALIWSIWRFVRIQGETCGVYTRSHLVYPFGILMMVLSLLNCIVWNEWTPFFFVMIFLVYAAFYFIYKRAIRFSAHMLLGFALLTGFEVCASFLFISTNGFGYVQEVFAPDAFDKLVIELPIEEFMVNISSENKRKLDQVLQRQGIVIGENDTLSTLSIRVEHDSALLDDLQAVQQQMIEEAKQDASDYVLRIQYAYYIDEYNQHYFEYIGNQENMNRHLSALLSLLLEEKGDYDLDYGVFSYTIVEEPEIIEEEEIPPASEVSDTEMHGDSEEGEADV